MTGRFQSCILGGSLGHMCWLTITHFHLVPRRSHLPLFQDLPVSEPFKGRVSKHEQRGQNASPAYNALCRRGMYFAPVPGVLVPSTLRAFCGGRKWALRRLKTGGYQFKGDGMAVAVQRV